MRFVELLSFRPELPVGEQQRQASAHFGEVVRKSQLDLWASADTAIAEGLVLVIGAAMWSRYDLELFDWMNEQLSRSNGARPHVMVFDMHTCRSQSDIQLRIPISQKVISSPVVGVWRAGSLVATEQGFRARDLIKQPLRKDEHRAPGRS